MRERLKSQRIIKKYANENSNVRTGFEVEPDHSIILTENGKEWTHAKKKLKEEFIHANGHA